MQRLFELGRLAGLSQEVKQRILSSPGIKCYNEDFYTGHHFNQMCRARFGVLPRLEEYLLNASKSWVFRRHNTVNTALRLVDKLTTFCVYVCIGREDVSDTTRRSIFKLTFASAHHFSIVFEQMRYWFYRADEAHTLNDFAGFLAARLPLYDKFTKEVPQAVLRSGGDQALEVYRDFAPERDDYTLGDSLKHEPNTYQMRALSFLQYHMHQVPADDAYQFLKNTGEYQVWVDFQNDKRVVVSKEKPRPVHRLPKVAVLAGSTGIGKSYSVALFARSHFQQTGEASTVVVPTDKLAEQWHAQLEKHGIAPETLCIVTWDRVMRGRVADRVKLDGGLVFFDEAHKLKSSAARWKRMMSVATSNRPQSLAVLVTATITDVVTKLTKAMSKLMPLSFFYSQFVLYDKFDLTAGIETQIIDCQMSASEQQFFDQINAYLYQTCADGTITNERVREVMRVLERVMKSGLFDADFQADAVIARLKAMDDAVQPVQKRAVHTVTGASHVESKNMTCPVCMVDFDPITPCDTQEEYEQQGDTGYVMTDCLHRYCRDCLGFWLERRNTCPLCRAARPKVVRHRRPPPVVCEEKKKREAEGEAGPAPKRARKEEAPLAFNSKHDRFLSDLEVWRQTHGVTDSLIVAADPEACDWYARTLGVTVNDFEPIRAPGGITVMAMKDHEGLNLDTASHLWLMTSGGGRAYELIQMVGRVTRYSQQKKVHVRYYVYPFGRFLVEYNRTGNLNPNKTTILLYMYHLRSGALGHARQVVENLCEVEQVTARYPQITLNDGDVTLDVRTGSVRFRSAHGVDGFYHYQHEFETDPSVTGQLSRKKTKTFQALLRRT